MRCGTDSRVFLNSSWMWRAIVVVVAGREAGMYLIERVVNRSGGGR
jgi:hypothetical protein